MSKKKKSTEFVDLVNSNPRIDREDLRLVLSAKLGMQSSLWIFAVGIILTTSLALITFPNDPLTLSIKYVVLAAMFGLYIKLRRRNPDDMLKRVLSETDYSDAKKIVEDRRAAKVS